VKSKRKKIILWTITLLSPLLILGALEGLFRLTGLFVEEPLALVVEKGGTQHLQFNMWVARRYFDPSKTAVPAMAPEVFEAVKSPATLRVICVGGSTTAGFPFDAQVPFPRQLQYLLQQRFPHRKVEVLNAGVSAVNSFTVLDLMPELLELQPDLMIVYMGHYEFYGAYGSASSVSLGKSDDLIRLVLKLQKLRIVQLVKRIVHAAHGPMVQSPPNKPLMAELVRDKEVPLGSEQYRSTMKAFRRNLDQICSLAAEHAVPVFVGTLISNVGDFPPFASATDSTAMRQLAAGRALVGADRLQEAGMRFAEAVAMDSGSAEAWFALGLSLRQRGDTLDASQCLYRAKDRDLMRFRAAAAANDIIREIARARKATVVDIQTWFEERSQGKLIGNNWLVDQLHPDPNGYFQMACCFFQAIDRSGLVGAPDTAFSPGEGPIHITDLDWNIGLLKVHRLMQAWPFLPALAKGKPFVPHGDTLSAKFAAEYLATHEVWSRAHYNLAELYSRRREFDRARREYEAVSMVAPDDPYPYRRIARTYELQADWKNRERALQEALIRSEEKGLILYHIALSQWKQGRLEEATNTMLQAVRLPDLKPDERLKARFFLAGFMSDAGKSAEARQLLTAIINENPGYKPARQFLQSLEKGNKR
jgi:tetratricopeptide (TPR) repeat protein